MDKPTLTIDQVFDAIRQERDNQDKKWGTNNQSLAGYLMIINKELQEAIDGWVSGRLDKHAPLNELVQVAAVAVACLEQYGISGNVLTRSDEKVFESYL